MNEIDMRREGQPTFAELTEQYYPYPSFVQELEKEVAEIVYLARQARKEEHAQYTKYGL